jgi:hypothetical protein
MFKPSLFILLLGAASLSSACIVTSSDDDATNPTTSATTQGNTSGQTSDPSTSGDASTDETAETAETTADPDETTAADETGDAPSCGWGLIDDPMVDEGYLCGGEGEDPSDRYPIECPEGLEEGAECGELTGVGCCDAEGNVWFCWDEAGTQTLVKEEC